VTGFGEKPVSLPPCPNHI